MKLASNKNKVRKLNLLVTVRQSDDPETYAKIVSNQVTLPDNSYVELIATSGGVRTIKLAKSNDTWGSALAITTVPLDVIVAMANKTEIAALTALPATPATDLATTTALANSLLTKVNSVISALKAAPL